MRQSLNADTRVILTLGLVNLLSTIKLYESEVRTIGGYGIAVDHHLTDAVNTAIDTHKANFKRATQETLSTHAGFIQEYDEIVDRALQLTAMPVSVFESYQFS
jgi:hypothetical protein